MKYDAAIGIANVLGWPAIHLAVAKIVLNMPDRYFAANSSLFAAWPWEEHGDCYRRWLAIRSWKNRLPDGAPWLGGFPKRRLMGRDQEYINKFILETRRAEFAHWCMLCCFPVFFLWNPPWACAVMALYGIAANLPCIVVQRYNRIVLAGLKDKSRRDSNGLGIQKPESILNRH